MDVMRLLTLRTRVRLAGYWLVIGAVGVVSALLMLPGVPDAASLAIGAVAFWVFIALLVGRLKDIGKRGSLVLVPLALGAAVIAAALALFPVILLGAALLMVPHHLDLEFMFELVLWLASTPCLVFAFWLGLKPGESGEPGTAA